MHPGPGSQGTHGPSTAATCLLLQALPVHASIGETEPQGTVAQHLSRLQMTSSHPTSERVSEHPNAFSQPYQDSPMYSLKLHLLLKPAARSCWQVGEPEIIPTGGREGTRTGTGQGGQKAKKQKQSYLSLHEHTIRPNTLPPILITAVRTEDTNSERLSDVPKATQRHTAELALRPSTW